MALRIALLATVAASMIMFSSAMVELPHRMRGGLAWKMHKARTAPVKAVPVQHFKQLLNHSAPTTSPTFMQRFWVNNEHWDAENGPIFLNICGEGPCGGPPGGWIGDLAATYNAATISIEHRFYGDSVPNNDFSVENLAFLNLDQNLADYANFIEWYNTQVSGTHTWFTFGGSYSGALSAMFRIRYPDHTAGSLSSSGVINTIFEFYQFDEQVAVSSGPACANVLRQTTAAIEAADKAGVNVRKMFNVPDDMSPGDFYYMVADSGAQAVQYGHKEILCSTMMNAAAKNLSLIETYINITVTLWGPDFTSDCFYQTNCLKNDPSQWQPTSRAWRWQKCSQMAYLQSAPANGSIRSKVVDIDYCVAQCHEIFGAGVDPQAGSEAVLEMFGGATPHSPANPDPSFIFYSNGGDDPWQRAAVRTTQSPVEPEDTAHCNDCGHCGDLFSPKPTDPPQLTAQRNMEAQYIGKWLAQS